jgi:hypothetical protein
LERQGLVQNLSQYAFIYSALNEFCLSTSGVGGKEQVHNGFTDLSQSEFLRQVKPIFNQQKYSLKSIANDKNNSKFINDNNKIQSEFNTLINLIEIHNNRKIKKNQNNDNTLYKSFRTSTLKSLNRSNNFLNNSAAAAAALGSDDTISATIAASYTKLNDNYSIVLHKFRIDECENQFLISTESINNNNKIYSQLSNIKNDNRKALINDYNDKFFEYWKIISENNCHIIVCLNSFFNEESNTYWPTHMNPLRIYEKNGKEKFVIKLLNTVNLYQQDSLLTPFLKHDFELIYYKVYFVFKFILFIYSIYIYMFSKSIQSKSLK